MKKIANVTFSHVTPMENLQDACWWVSVKILEGAKKKEKRSRDALDHNRKRVIVQMEKMGLIKD